MSVFIRLREKTRTFLELQLVSDLLLVLLLTAGFFPRTLVVRENKTISSALVIFMLLIFFLIIYRRWTKKVKLTTDEYLAFLYFITASLSTFIISPGLKAVNYYHPAGFAICYTGISSYVKLSPDKKELARKILTISMLISLAVIPFLIYDFYVIFPRLHKWGGLFLNKSLSWKFLGPYHNPNQISFVMLIGFFSSISLFLMIRGRPGVVKYVWLLPAAAFIPFMLISASRAVLLCTLIYTVLVIVRGSREASDKGIMRPAAVLFLFLFVILTAIFPDYLISHARCEIWRDFFDSQWRQFPSPQNFFGYGYSFFKTTLNKQPHLHNLFLEIWGRQGIVNLIILSTLLFILLKGQGNKNLWMIRVILPVYLIRELFEVTLFYKVYQWESFFFFFMALTALEAGKNTGIDKTEFSKQPQA